MYKDPPDEVKGLQEDVEALYRAGEDKTGTNESTFITIMVLLFLGGKEGL